MADGTTIAWTDATWNAMRGCSRTIAEGAAQSGCGDPSGGGCYAERSGYRFAGPGLAYEGLVRMTPNGARWTGKVLLVDKHLLDPIRWTEPRHIFTTSVSDPFHERFSNEAIALIVGVMVITPWHTHQMLTKRARRMREWFEWVAKAAAECNMGRGMTIPAYCFTLLQRYVNSKDCFTAADRKLLSKGGTVEQACTAPWPLPNLWPMVSVENQAAADERIPELLRVPAVVHGLSCEPLLDRVDLSKWMSTAEPEHGGPDRDYHCTVCGSEREPNPALDEHECPPGFGPSLTWVIAGCESGPRARACKVEWLRLLRDQCAEAGVAYLLKQAEELQPINSQRDTQRPAIECGAKSDVKGKGPEGEHIIELPYLDGRQHAQFPNQTECIEWLA